MSIKEEIVDVALEMGFERVVIGSLEPMEKERREFEKWLSKGYAASMEYLKRNPHCRSSPQLLLPGSKSAIIVSVSYYTPQPQSPAPYFGKVARYAVGLDYHLVLRRKMAELEHKIAAKLSRPLRAKAFTDDVQLLEQAYAARHGLGFAGRNTLIIGPRLSGSYYFIAELFCDLELPCDQPYVGTCGQCFRCGNSCPTGAIASESSVDANLCISFLTIENKEGIPLSLREPLGDWVFGCDVCQEVCPYNQKPPLSPWVEFHPQSGVGHYLDLLSVLDIKNNKQFLDQFGRTPLRRAKRRGLLRNALVCLGNALRQARRGDCDSSWVVAAKAKISRLACEEEDHMLREHALWSLSQS